MAPINTHFSFDVGLEQVTRLADPGPVRLPDASDMAPSEAGLPQQLVDLLYPPSIEQSLLRWLRPDVTHRRILNPPDFHAALEDCRDDLERRASAAPAGSDREKLQGALQELHGELDLRRLLMTYRHLLHRA